MSEWSSERDRQTDPERKMNAWTSEGDGHTEPARKRDECVDIRKTCRA